MNDFLLIFTSMAIEAFPFLLIGSLAASVVEEYFSPEKLEKFFRRPFSGAVCAAAGGLVFPVCECGIVPVAARLAGKGVPASSAIAFMLAAPIINPFVLLSTYVAFGGNLRIVILRAGSALVAALIGAYLFRGESLPEKITAGHCSHCHSKDHESRDGRFFRIMSMTGNELLHMAVPFFIGVSIAVLFRLFILRGIRIEQGLQSFAAIPLSMGAAMLMSVCSEADAFIAAPLLNLPLSARLAFIVIGPMVDIKLFLQWRRFFSPTQIFRLAVLVPMIVWVLMMLVEALGLLRGGFLA
ncbi:permease [Marispirochaeta aestuarii]|uniref:permease n=1 Tax=Marispirochaeta aestuarii TaxID=1963862 RepID=UPI002ABE7ACB|nr:permease [Marispirochaeta aestuarii]